jgi:hypothetical protein
VRQGNKTAKQAEWIRFRGAVSGVGRGNKQKGKQNTREVESEQVNKRGERDKCRWTDKRRHNRIDSIQVLQAIFIQVF